MTRFITIRQIVDFAVLPLMNVAVALLISGLVVLFVGQNPLEAVGYLVAGSLGSGEGIGFTLYFATSFMFTGLAVAVASHAGLFTIGAEGQAYLGGLAYPDAAHLHPLDYARGLARAAAAAGVRIFETSRATRRDGARVATADGAVTARHVLLATNGYHGDLDPRVTAGSRPAHPHPGNSHGSTACAGAYRFD